MNFEVATKKDGRAVQVALQGEFDLGAVTTFDDELKRIEAERPDVLVIDLGGLSFMDSSGLRALVMADDRARSQNRRLAIVPGPAQVRRVFEITRLDQRLDLVDDPSAI